MRLSLPYDHVLNNVILCIENDVPELSKILNNILVFKVALNKNRSALVVLEVGILDKLFNKWIEYSIELLTLGQP